MKKVLIISPYFPPSNAADMQRIRMSLPFFKDFGWEAEVVTVHPKHSDFIKDELLTESVPEDIQIHFVEAVSKKITSAIGLGSIAVRSLLFYKRKVNRLLKEKTFDLIYFSTTQFPVCVLGAYWRKKFNIPYVIDMQDPWHSDYYKDKPRSKRPPKYWFSYRLNKYLEPIALKKVSGLISVSKSYVRTLQQRYPQIENIPSSTITFGAFSKDFDIMKAHRGEFKPKFSSGEGIRNLVYIGRGGNDMEKALSLFFRAFKSGLQEQSELFERFRIYFIGTSYASAGHGKKTIYPIAEQFGLKNYVLEQTDRIPFYEGLYNLQESDGLIVPGSDDAAYTASKIYPYILTGKPFLGIFHEASSVVKIVTECGAGEIITLQDEAEDAYKKVESYLRSILANKKPQTNWKSFELYSAKEMTRKQCRLFNKVLDAGN